MQVWKEMQAVTLRDREQYQFSFEDETILTDVGTSIWVVVPGGIAGITMTLSMPDNGDDTPIARVETTTDLLRNVIIDSPDLIIFPWTEGDISYCVQTVCFPVTAFRLVYISGIGEVKLTSRAQ